MLDPRQLGRCITAHWSPAIGDPTVWGWSVVAAYGLAALAALAVARLRAPAGRERAFWVIVALAMAALAVNKQLDLQSALTAAGRCVAQAQGWYEERRRVQAEFIVILAAFCGFVCLLGLLAMRRHLLRCGLAVVGLSAVVTWVLIRAVGFHHIDALLSRQVVRGVAANPVLELAGIVLVILNAAIFLLSSRGRTRPARRPGYRP